MVNLIGFNGERQDPITGSSLLGNGYRAYGPKIMRFSQPDSMSPSGLGGINPYAYCGNDPVNRTDPSGHMSVGGIASIVGGVVGLVMLPFTLGQSLTVTTLILASLEVASGITAIISGATEETHPQLSSGLGWSSLTTGLLTAGVGMLPSMVKLTGKLNQLAGQWLQDSSVFLRKIVRKGNQMGIPLSGEFANAMFLGEYWAAGHLRWGIRFEDKVPRGNRLNIIMGSVECDGLLQACMTTQSDGCWYNKVITPYHLKHYAKCVVEDFDIYRLLIADSGVTAGGHPSYASRFYNALDTTHPVVGFKGELVVRGVVAEELLQTFSTLEQLHQVGYGNLGGQNSAQQLLNGLSVRYGQRPGALMAEGVVNVFPRRLRCEYEQVNFH